ncbi:MAG: formylglycine-generating enzyme family protein, partial [Bacteroidota bacterium]
STSNSLTVEEAVLEIEANMVKVEGGSFNMGSNDKDDDEKPIHKVSLSGFYISKYEITQAQYTAFMGNNPSKFSNCSQCPVERVSWHDANAFIRKLNTLTGKRYRLPTEAEWEYATREGQKSQSYTYSGGDELGELGWYNDNSGSKTQPVGKKKANELGLYDMSGNVYEWCADWYGNDYYSASQGAQNPKGPTRGEYRVIRGGSWNVYLSVARVSNRNFAYPIYRFNYVGFRLCRY